MSNDQIGGKVKQGLGRVEDAAGGLVGDDKLQAKGDANQVSGTIQDAVGKAKDMAQESYGKARDAVQDGAGQVHGFVQDQPYAALACAATGGLILGLLLRRGPKIIYVRPGHN